MLLRHGVIYQSRFLQVGGMMKHTSAKGNAVQDEDCNTEGYENAFHIPPLIILSLLRPTVPWKWLFTFG